ncbi:hypothetical protein B0T24DRAFT_677873 [Lasiosphaeria ovina]|uniref:BTB domain-containing protein n=1 Tax=Lasiosphaeria ovina TaxID=92902 RepID=A0AAE0KHV0_9PEZI|nr:hypothetical protein B0T24DRAFT_677873 [Lasiosphaeria ovina]
MVAPKAMGTKFVWAAEGGDLRLNIGEQEKPFLVNTRVMASDSKFLKYKIYNHWARNCNKNEEELWEVSLPDDVPAVWEFLAPLMHDDKLTMTINHEFSAATLLHLCYAVNRYKLQEAEAVRTWLAKQPKKKSFGSFPPAGWNGLAIEQQILAAWVFGWEKLRHQAEWTIAHTCKIDERGVPISPTTDKPLDSEYFYPRFNMLTGTVARIQSLRQRMFAAYYRHVFAKMEATRYRPHELQPACWYGSYMQPTRCSKRLMRFVLGQARSHGVYPRDGTALSPAPPPHQRPALTVAAYEAAMDRWVGAVCAGLYVAENDYNYNTLCDCTWSSDVYPNAVATRVRNVATQIQTLKYRPLAL